MTAWLYETPHGTFRAEPDDLAQALVLLRAAIIRSGVWVPFPQSTTIRRKE